MRLNEVIKNSKRLCLTEQIVRVNSTTISSNHMPALSPSPALYSYCVLLVFQIKKKCKRKTVNIWLEAVGGGGGIFGGVDGFKL